VSRLLVIGAGGHGAVVAETAEASGQWNEIGFLDDDESLDAVLDFPVLGTTKMMSSLANQDSELFVAVGDNRHRLELCEQIIRGGLRLATVVHPRAIVSRSATIAAGTIVCAGAVVSARAEVGLACILNTGSTVDHDCKLEDGVHVSPGANLAGTVHVQRCAWIGIGAAVREGSTIGRYTVVGAGSAVVCNIGDALTVGGVPAKALTKL
jgi:sugar O-acyltransferase (sialic acid O-acetyltransferase NeuD family)